MTTEIIWRKGEKYEKSLKTDKPEEITKPVNNALDKYNMQHTKPTVGLNPIREYIIPNAQAIAQGPGLSGNEIFTTNSKRDSFNDKLSSRYLVGQIKQNPFMQKNNYLKDLDTQNNFLIPKSSNTDDK